MNVSESTQEVFGYQTLSPARHRGRYPLFRSMYYSLLTMSTIQKEFDRIALVSNEGGNHNDHYHNFLLRHFPSNCQNALEIGCGTGAFARDLAELSRHVFAIDVSPEMIRIARSHSEHLSNLEFQVIDICEGALSENSFDCIASIATLHHLPLRDTLLRMKAALRPNGVLLVLDLFEQKGLIDALLTPVAVAVSVALRLIHQGRLRPSREVREAWAAHERHDTFPTMNDVRRLCAEILPGAKIRKHLLWRYSVIWQKPDEAKEPRAY